MSRGKVWTYLGVGVIGAFVGIGNLLTAVVLVLHLFANTLKTQKINLANIGYWNTRNLTSTAKTIYVEPCSRAKI